MKALATLALCCLLSPASILVAQSTPTAQPPAQIYEKLFSSQQEEVVSAAEAMPDDKYNFVPTKGTFEGVRTFGQQVTHIAASQYYYFGNFGIKSGVDSDAIDKLTRKDDIVKALKDSYAFAHQAIETITAENAFDRSANTRAPAPASGRGTGPHQRPLRTDGRLSAHERDHSPRQPQALAAVHLGGNESGCPISGARSAPDVGGDRWSPSYSFNQHLPN